MSFPNTAAYYLLMDFGTTSLKTAVVDLDTGFFSHVRSFPSLLNCCLEPGRFEVLPAALTDRFLSVCNFYYYELCVPFEGIVLCSEQNGSLVLDEHDRPLTNYIGWKDERSLEPIDGVSTFDQVMGQLGERFKRITGTRPGPNLPLMSVAHLGRLSGLPKRIRLASLPEWLDLSCGDSTHVVHGTMLHSLSFYDVRARRTSDELVQFVEDLAGVRCTFNDLAPTSTISGYWHGEGRPVPIYVGVGDHQACVLGAGNEPRRTVSINAGTSSQVAVIDGDPGGDEFELRPYFDDRLLSAMTRVPAGRSLASFVRLLEEASGVGGGGVSFWTVVSELDEADVERATLCFDLATFGSAWGYRGGGTITGISDGSLTVKNYLASLLKSWVAQYADLIPRFDPTRTVARCILSGGLPRRLPNLAAILSRTSGYVTWPACAVDESLLGLRGVALMCAGRAPTCLEGQAVYGRTDTWASR
jgi:sugar (pentulose or hexulose) kinase